MIQSFIFHGFKMSELRRFNISVFIKIIGRSLIGIFIPIFLYKNGFSIFEILLFYGLISIAFVALGGIGTRLISKIGAKHAILLSAFFEITFFLLMPFVVSHYWLLLILPIIFAIEMILFNISYHLIFTLDSHTKNRGREIANVGMLVVLAGIVSPFIGGIIADLNFTLLFLISAGFILLSSLPLLFTKDLYQNLDFKIKDVWKNIFKKSERGNTLSFASYGAEHIINVVIWPIIIISIVGSLEKTGLIVSASAVISLITYKIIGHLSDTLENKKLIKLGTYLHSVAWFTRIFVQNMYSIIVIDSYKNIAQKILHVPWTNQSYTLAMKNNFYEFIVRKEYIFHLSRIFLYILLGLVFWINIAPFTITLIIAGITSLGYKFINS
ncbi:MAG: MFS transporter [Candidatus Pacebacteria bacterium]|nr:MFS transporter [Candidatus Paceibacterota bacterium]